jgi:predicted nucleic acid-binding protein
MILTDAGPLIAILDRGEQHHRACVECLAELTGPMLTAWPAFTEAMYLLGEAGGWVAQDALWALVEQGDVEIAEQGLEHRGRMRALMEKYQDQRMDLADAALVALAEKRGLRDIFTLDHADFQVYRFHRRQAFRLWPRSLD